MQEVQRIKVTQVMSYPEATKKFRPAREQTVLIPTMREERKETLNVHKNDHT